MTNSAPKRRSPIAGNLLFLILSFALAVGAWVLVAFVVSPDTSRVIHDVPVLLDERDAAYKSFGLHVVTAGEHEVDVTVSGARSLINTLTAENIRVTPNYSGVEQPGEYTLGLAASAAGVQQGVTIQQPKDTVRLTFDAESRKTLALEVRVEDVLADEGLIFGNNSVSPAEVTVSGPEAEINRVKSAAVSYDGGGEILERSKETIAEVVLYDENGKEVSKDNLQLSSGEAEITVPVLMRGTLGLEIEFVNVPEGFDVSTLNYVMSQTEIPVAADRAVIENLRPKVVGEVDLAKFEIGAEWRFDVLLPSNIRNVDGVESVTVTFPRESLASKRVRVSEIKIDNAPVNYDIEALTQYINNVTVIGPQEDLDNLLDTSVVAVVDVGSFYTVETGERDVAARFRISSSDSLWVAGVYTVSISVTPN